ncbi:cyclic nucleotide-gated potassium channel [Kordia sp. SMS9]|uniref:ion transporter n=1 Tax=Kordia sp. SMS9 TaxID=2282170 RepID=UPI000E0D8035|nr:ion transporter [Kordia sp. SMS9]AXG70987.1 cyclic nucleotide-gated potassium channel [Kordia sp. SMS9]
MAKSWKSKLHEIIYEADTPAGKLFDIVLLILILASIALVMLESVDEFRLKHGKFLDIAEWVITILFSIEYIARIISIRKPSRYIFSFYGVIDFLSTIPKYLSLFIVGSQSLIALRALRLMRVFRILKLTRYIGESNNIMRALRASRIKIGVFIMFILILCTILGSIMYLIESNEESGFTSIPRSIYWAIVTLTTVGYGDIAPLTPLGQSIASIIMILGYGIIAVPTGIVTAELASMEKDDIQLNTLSCSNCATEGHRNGAEYCFDCGEPLHPEETD